MYKRRLKCSLKTTVTSNCCSMYLFLLLALIPAYALANDVCPPENFSEQCVCDRATVYHKSDLTCRYLDSNEEIKRVVSEYKDRGFENINIQTSKIQCFPSSVFLDKVVKILRIYWSGLDSVFCEPPRGARYLEELEIIDCKVEQQPPVDFLIEMERLENFTATKLNFGSGAFLEYTQPSIRRIKLYDCNINDLPKEVLRLKSNVEEIHIDVGGITELTRQMFPPQAKIVNMTFEDNKIQEIVPDLWNDMPYLKYVSLARNQISKLPEDAFRTLLNYDSLETVSVEENPIKCDCDAKWIGELDDGKRNKLIGTCEQPKTMHGTNLRDLRSNHFQDC